MSALNRTATSLLMLRLSIFAVMLVWTLDKFINPAHAARVYERFYFISGLGETEFVVIGVAELALLAAFVVGWRKRWTYGAVFALHAVSTLSSYQQYLAPFEYATNLLFFAAWPMLAACFTLYNLRHLDTRLTL
ncbi:MAG: hypothetical protein ACE5G3_04345 [Gammaproteobacteria bacterium]